MIPHLAIGKAIAEEKRDEVSVRTDTHRAEVGDGRADSENTGRGEPVRDSTQHPPEGQPVDCKRKEPRNAGDEAPVVKKSFRLFGKTLKGVVLGARTGQTAIFRLMARYKIPMTIKADGRTVPVTIKPEQRFSIHLADRLRELTLTRRYRGIWSHIPNEGERSRLFGVLLKAMGLIPGATDYFFIWATGAGVIELKVHPETMSDTQLDYRDWCVQSGVNHACVTCEADTHEARAKAVTEVESHLTRWGAL